MLWVQLPPGPLGKAACGFAGRRFRFTRLAGQDTGLSHRKEGFDSPVDHCDTWVAQPVERLSEEQEIVGSTPTPGIYGIQNDEFKIQNWKRILAFHYEF